MALNKLNLRQLVLVGTAMLLLIGFLIKMNCTPKGESESSINLSKAIDVKSEASEITVAPMANVLSVEDKEEIEGISEVKEQMVKERAQLKNMKLLYMELDQIKLQYEKEKTLSEIKKLRKENVDIAGEVDVSSDKVPEVRILFIGTSNKQKEAIITINGVNYSVKEKDKPTVGVEVLSIGDTSIEVNITGKENVTKTIVYRGN